VTDFVGRADPIAKLSTWLREEPARGSLAIGSISGPGGVGKSFLLGHVLRSIDLSSRNFLTLRLQGADGPRTLTDLISRDLLGSCQDLVDGKSNVFGVTLNARRNLELMDAKARAELEQAFQANPELVKTVAALYSLGVGLLELVPLPEAKIAARIGKKLDPKLVGAVVERIQRVSAYHAERRLWNGVLPDLFQRGARNRLRTNLAEALADYLVTDLAAILSGYRRKDWRRFLPSKIPGRDNLLLIIDDYESVCGTLSDFLLTYFVPALTRVKFMTLILVIGRDRLVDTNVGWQQHFERHLVGDIALTSFTPDEARQYVVAHGIEPAATIDRIVTETAGFPYLLHAEVEAELKGGRTALALKMFFDRTTRCMNDDQKAWLRALSFLQTVDREAIQAVLPSEDADHVLEWFKAEASIRDPNAGKWSVLPIIRSRIQEYVRNDSEQQYADLQQAASRCPRPI